MKLFINNEIIPYNSTFLSFGTCELNFFQQQLQAVNNMFINI